MLNVPATPQIQITRQLNCVSCQHQFTIAEDDAIRDKSPSDNWHLPPKRTPDVQMRYQPDRSRRTVAAETRAEPDRDPTDYQNWEDIWEQINCPRCGADNRNWLQVLFPPHQPQAQRLKKWRKTRFAAILLGIIAAFGVALVFVALVLPFFENVSNQLGVGLLAIGALSLLALIPTFWIPSRAIMRIVNRLQQFNVALLGVMITAILVFMAAADTKITDHKTTLLVVIALAGVVPIMAMLSGWIKLREYKAFRTIVPSQSSFELSPPLRTWMISTVLFLFILPFFLYILKPGVFYFAFELINASEKTPVAAPPTLSDRVTNVRAGLEDILVHAPPGSTDMIEEAINDLLQFMTDVPLPVDALSQLTLEQKANITLAWLNDLANNSSEEAKPPVLDAIAALERHIESTGAVSSLQSEQSETEEETADNNDESALPPWLDADKALFSAWFKYVLAASIAALVFGMAAVHGYVSRINFHLPRYLFHSIANMTRVVIWEAGAALEIEDEVHLIQWTNAQRNEIGGIDLTGYYRDPVSSEKEADAFRARVRAQRYDIRSNRWGHIETAQITDVFIPVRPRMPRLPDNRAENDISNDFFRTAVPIRETQQREESP